MTGLLLEPTLDMMTALIQSSLDAVVIADADGRIIEFNPAAERVFGYTREQLIGHAMSLYIIPPHLRQAHDRGMAHYLATGEGPVLHQRIEITAMRADGAIFPVELTIIPTRVHDEPVFISHIRDISERRANDHLLSQTATRLGELIENLQGGVLVEDETRHIALINHAFCEMFAIPLEPADLIGTDCSGSAEQSKYLFVDPEVFVARIDAILADRRLVTGETLHLVDGRVFQRDYVPIFSEGEYTGHLWHYHDVSQQFQTRRRWKRLLAFEEVNREVTRLFLQLDNVDDAMNQALALTGQLLDVSRTYVFRFREHERIIDNTHEWCAPGVKPEIENLQGLPFDELLPSFFPLIARNELIAPRHINELPDDLRGILEPQDIKTILWIPIYLQQRIEGFLGYDETRAPRDWLPEEITMARIITESYARALEREQAARVLIQTRDEALRTARLRSQFVANMSHEIRTPLTGILGMLELLMETPLDDLQREFAGEAFHSSTRLMGIINDILDFSRLEAGQLVLDTEPIDLRAVATEVKQTLLPRVRQKPVTLRLELDPEVPYRVRGDAGRIRQVLMNLVGNAIKFTEQGTITLSVEFVNQVNEAGYVRFTVADTGIGIAPDALERIFENFVQADGGTTRKYGGSGLGLSISRQLVELMGGEITVTSQPGMGSTFSFTLALPLVRAVSTYDNPLNQFGELTILLIDDNRTARYVLAQQLENWGVQVTQLETVEEVMAARTRWLKAFDLLLLRYPQPPLAAHLQDVTGVIAARVVYITDSRTDHPGENRREAPQNNILTLRYPIDQSTLYNLLIQTRQAASISSAPVRVGVQPDDTSHNADQHLPAPPAAKSPWRILLAEDYELNVDLVLRALEDLNVTIDTVANGEQALASLAQHSYDLVLMDMHMPVMDGMEATRRIRQSVGTYHTIPIIAVTASVMRSEQEAYLRSGVNEVISKPFSINYLRRVVLRWLEQIAAG